MWGIFAFSFYFYDGPIAWIDNAYMILSLGYLSHYAYDNRFGYLNINDDFIHKNVLYSFKNKIKIGDITEIDRIDGNYLLKSEKGNLKIKPDLIEKASLKRLNEELVSWGLPPEKTVFYS